MISIDEDKLLDMAYASIQWCKEFQNEKRENERESNENELKLIANSKVIQSS